MTSVGSTTLGGLGAGCGSGGAAGSGAGAAAGGRSRALRQMGQVWFIDPSVRR
jgi:F0F1-type ATP synthase membrane subunit c/vacuolar-type H+-ATPase subunit K